MAESILALSRKEEMRLMDFEYSSLVGKANASRKMASWQVTNNNILLCQVSSIKHETISFYSVYLINKQPSNYDLAS